MSVEWERDESGLTVADIERRQPYKLEPHHFATRRRIAWPVCKRCGLVLLRNDLTEWFAKRGCNAGDHPDAKAAIARLGRRSS